MLKDKKKIIIFLVIFCLVFLISFKNKVYGNTIYFSGTTSSELQIAVNNAANNDTIVLQNDINIDNVIEIPANKNITLTDNGTVIILKRDPTYDSGTGWWYGQLGYFFYIPSTSTLNLKGSSIDTLVLDGNNVALKGGIGSERGVIKVVGTLNIYDGVVIKNCNYAYKHKSVTAIAVEGVFNMYGGVIKDNNLTMGAVDMGSSAGRFNMYGGVILNNSNNYYERYDDGSRYYSKGGGVFCGAWYDYSSRTYKGSTFNMLGGKVINNSAHEKGSEGYYGLYVSNYATFNKSGGIISDNYTLISGIVLSGSSTVNIGQTITLTSTVSPSNVIDKNLLWFSSDNNIAYVDQNGNVTGVSPGTVVITGAANDGSGIKATKTITVKATNIIEINIEGNSKVSKGDIVHLKAIITPTNASNKTLIWTSSNTNIATVNGTGLVGTVRGISPGTAYITATATDGSGKSATFKITVTDTFISEETNCILVGQKIKYVTNYTDSENDPLYSYSYYYSHNPDYYNNSLGYIDNNNKWLNEPIVSFNKTGHYLVKIKSKDNPPTSSNNENFANYRKDSNIIERNLFVHRKPIAVFILNDATVTDKSYDLDHQSSLNKGIVNWEWNYINSNGTVLSYTTNNKSKGEAEVKKWLTDYGMVNAKLFLRVQDVEGAWSDWSDDLPVADFIISYNPMVLNKDVQKIIDTSYDSKGLPLIEYSWTVKKGSSVLFTSNLQDISSLLNTYVNNNGIGIYTISLRVKNSNNQYSNTRTQDFNVIEIPKNLPPSVDFELSSKDNWTFPRKINTNTLYRNSSNTNMFFYEEPIKFNVSVNEPENQNLKYEWELENLSNTGAGIKKYSGISNQDNPIIPFANSFENTLGFGGGYYRVTLKVTDIPIAPYDSNDFKSSSVTKYYYIVPKISLTASFESTNAEIMVGDKIKLKATSSKLVEDVKCIFNDTYYYLNKKSEDESYIYWEREITIPDSITDSGIYNLKFIASTTYGDNGSVTREVEDIVPIDIVALKLINFRITNIVNHLPPEFNFPYRHKNGELPVQNYKTGYYVTFEIDSKGKPDYVNADIDINNNGIDKNISMTKIATGETEIWQGKFYTPTLLPSNTPIYIKLNCSKGSITYDYNEKENWDGLSLITKGSALMDGRINLTR